MRFLNLFCSVNLASSSSSGPSLCLSLWQQAIIHHFIIQYPLLRSLWISWHGIIISYSSDNPNGSNGLSRPATLFFRQSLRPSLAIVGRISSDLFRAARPGFDCCFASRLVACFRSHHRWSLMVRGVRIPSSTGYRVQGIGYRV